MKMWAWFRISSFGLVGLIRRSPTVRVLLKRGESPVVSVSRIRRFIRLRNLFGLYCFVDFVLIECEG